MSKGLALVTGGGRGLGRAIAGALAADGYRVAVTGRDAGTLAAFKQEFPDSETFVADVADESRAAEVVAALEAQGPLEVVVNNAGIGGGDAGPQPFAEMSMRDWWRVYETNVKGPALYSHAALPAMLVRGSGVIVNVGSYIAIRPMPESSAYGPSKAALARFTDALACEVGDAGVQVFCLSPGLVLTDMTRGLPFIKEIPASEFFQPEDIAQHVCRLATGAYAALNGCFLHVADDLDELRDNGDRIREERLYSLRLDGLEGLIP